MIFARRRNPKSQIAVIITLIIAAILLFVFVVVNIAQVSGIKRVTAQVSDRAALELASKIGSMGHYLRENVLEGAEERKCKIDWITLLIFVGVLGVILIIGFPMIGWGIGALLLGVSMGGLLTLREVITASQPIHKAIYEQFKGMSVYNAIREATLYQALAALQTDDVLLKPEVGSEGFFYEDINGDGVYDPVGEPFTDTNGNGVYDSGESYTDTNDNGVYDAGEPYTDANDNGVYDPPEPFTDSNGNGVYDPPELLYDLSKISELKKAPVTGRFFAWYYTKRVPLILEEGLKDSIDDFITDLKDYIDIDNWDETKWEVTQLSLTVESIDVTCPPPDCPSWVADAGEGRVRAITTDIDGNHSGFLRQKFIELSERLENRYDLSFCGPVFLWWGTECGNIDNVIEDLRMFLLRGIELLNLPISARVQGVTEWIGLFYDLDYEHSNSGGDHDIYDRLTQDEVEIDNWIFELSEVDALIRDTIRAPNGHNEYGLGAPVSECFTLWDCCPDSSDCEEMCCLNPKNCSFAGIYCSACGSDTPPVCVRGDLYGTIPEFCPLEDHDPGCDPNCAGCNRDPQCPSACNFQGQFPGGPTEVGQALAILTSLSNDINDIKAIIESMADNVRNLLSRDDPLRNEIIYAWEGKDRRPHLTQVKIEDYPEDLPYVTEEREWWGLIKCRVLHSYNGNFSFTGSRYDEDLPETFWWKFRYHKKEEEAEEADYTPILRRIIRIIHNIYNLPPTGYEASMQSLIASENDENSDLSKILKMAITSKTRGYYDPDKENIRIERLE